MSTTVRQGPPSIIKAAERLLTEIEGAVAAFPRAHRYTLGADLRADAVRIVLLCQQAYRAMRDRPRQAQHVGALAETVDMARIRLQLAQRLQCMSFGRFELLTRVLVDVGRQCGGWQRQITSILNGQNPAPRQPERATTLSTRAASKPEAYA